MWIVTAHWHGKSLKRMRRETVLAASSQHAVELAKAGFAARANRVWAIRDVSCTRCVMRVKGTRRSAVPAQ